LRSTSSAASSLLNPDGEAPCTRFQEEATDLQTDDLALNSVVLDLDGVLWVGGSPGHGAAAFLDWLGREGIPFCILTNDCSVSKVDRYKSLTQAGFILNAEQLVTAAEVTRDWLRDMAARTIMYLGAPSSLTDLAGEFCVRESAPVDAVVVGDLFAHFDRGAIDRAAKAISEGAILVAMQRNQRWSDGIDWHVDNGFWVAGFEYVTGKKAVVMGKPHSTAYRGALARLGLTVCDPSKTFFVSDDIESDLRGAKEVGLKTVYFGSPNILPRWVDYVVENFSSLTTLLIGGNHE
jgi:HAD superfamily hydrolase (TIGR01450 family)